MTGNEQFIVTKTKFGKWILISFVVVLLSGCSSNKEEINEEAPRILTSEQEAKADNEESETVEEKEIGIAYDDFEYLDLYNHYNSEFTDTSDEAFADLEELTSNYSLVNDEKWMTSFQVKIKRLTGLNEIFINLSDENRVPDVYLKLHKLTQENIGSSILAANNFIEGIKTYDTTLLDETIKLTDKMALNLDAMLLEDQRISSYLQEKLRTEEKTAAAIKQEETVIVNSDTKTRITSPGDYNSLGEYQPVESMTQDEIQRELEMFLERAIGQ